MDAVTLIKNNLNVETILSNYNIECKHFGNYIRCACPIHGGDNDTAFVINEDFLWSCHTGECGSGDAFTFISKMEELELPQGFPKVVEKLAQMLDLDIENLEIASRKNEYTKEVEKFLKYIKTKKKEKKEIKEFNLGAEQKQVKKFRDFKEDTLIEFKLGYIKEVEVDKKAGGTFTLSERLAIPIINEGITVGYSLRKIRASDNPKWFHTPPTIETSELLYNFDNCKDCDEIIVVEGMFDVWKWYEAGFKNVVCTFGAHLTNEQYRMLLRSGKNIIWCYDGDDAGKIATEKAIKVMKYKTNQWKINLPEGQDPGGCKIEELQELYKEKERLF